MHNKISQNGQQVKKSNNIQKLLQKITIENQLVVKNQNHQGSLYSEKITSECQFDITHQTVVKNKSKLNENEQCQSDLIKTVKKIRKYESNPENTTNQYKKTTNNPQNGTHAQLDKNILNTSTKIKPKKSTETKEFTQKSSKTQSHIDSTDSTIQSIPIYQQSKFKIQVQLDASVKPQNLQRQIRKIQSRQILSTNNSYSQKPEQVVYQSIIISKKPKLQQINSMPMMMAKTKNKLIIKKQ